MKKNDEHNEELVRQKVADLLLIAEVIDRMELRRILGHAVGQHGNETFCASDSLILLSVNHARTNEPVPTGRLGPIPGYMLFGMPKLTQG